MSVVILFNIVLFNLIVALLAHTFNIFDENSNGLFLTKILETRDELLYDESYGSFLSALPPFNSIQIPFVPVAIILPYQHHLLVALNDFLMKI